MRSRAIVPLKPAEKPKLTNLWLLFTQCIDRTGSYLEAVGQFDILLQRGMHRLELLHHLFHERQDWVSTPRFKSLIMGLDRKELRLMAKDLNLCYLDLKAEAQQLRDQRHRNAQIALENLRVDRIQFEGHFDFSDPQDLALYGFRKLDRLKHVQEKLFTMFQMELEAPNVLFIDGMWRVKLTTEQQVMILRRHTAYIKQIAEDLWLNGEDTGGFFNVWEHILRCERSDKRGWDPKPLKPLINQG